jgi:hypothetical protein
MAHKKNPDISVFVIFEKRFEKGFAVNRRSQTVHIAGIKSVEIIQ